MRLEAPQEGHSAPKSTIQTARKHKWANLLNKYYFQDLWDIPSCSSLPTNFGRSRWIWPSHRMVSLESCGLTSDWIDLFLMWRTALITPARKLQQNNYFLAAEYYIVYEATARPTRLVNWIWIMELSCLHMDFMPGPRIDCLKTSLIIYFC
jgi:hypothetical protein